MDGEKSKPKVRKQGELQALSALLSVSQKKGT